MEKRTKRNGAFYLPALLAAVLMLMFYAGEARSHHCGGETVRLACAGGEASGIHEAECAHGREKTGGWFARLRRRLGMARRTDAERSTGGPEGSGVFCPVMGTGFVPQEDTVSVEHGGKTYYFCCPGCEEVFKADPGKYTGRGEKQSGR